MNSNRKPSVHQVNALTDEGLDFLNDRLTDITCCFEDLYLEPQRDEAPIMERCERILPTVLFDELVAYIQAARQHHNAVCHILYSEDSDLRADGYVVATDEQPFQPLITDEEAAALIEPLPVQAAPTDDGYAPHPCMTEGCAASVPYDDEPMCFTHSPDQGSSVRGWSYKAYMTKHGMTPL